ncbi:DUF115 domain-containing protein [Marinobacter sp. NP-4(2019)]|uniref:motility associated factor glycosyltransferase family protein n=1 Tax=Marinobacter sp. NP-4(2019) TaxID=2488665 RepID=UPI000FC3DA90|nr:6-hydroxymethylpterin diphosphokinase MptE-like protein [Marinobacter sp. NP-4(2019)]AZT84482.1 DUF115 domain-containing protein [Marinobacter sp. NP-4(2019)]
MLDFSKLTEEDFIARKIKNLQFFNTYYKGIYDHFLDLQLSRLELSITPGSKDVDVLEGGASLYPNGAVDTAGKEARDFIRMFSERKRIKNFRLRTATKLPYQRFALDLIYQCASESPVSARPFAGYIFDEFVPSVVFLGVGLGLHIDEITRSIDIVNAIIYEPDPEFFALSMFVVDWQAVWARFEKKGYSLSFVISSNYNSDEHVRMLENEMKKSIPFHPDFTVFLSHRSDERLIKIFEGVRDRLPVINANWDNLDRQVDHLNQQLHNLERHPPIIFPRQCQAVERPIVIVGSGPSLDNRIESIKAHRRSIVLMSAGTGLRALLRNGIEPDFHVELDSDFVIYDIISNSGLSPDNNIVLFAKSTVNPLVTDLFSEVFLFHSAETNDYHFLGHSEAFAGASPTCTNAALSLATNLGFRNIFLAGSDYGFLSESSDHSEHSVYGALDNSDFVQRFQATVGGRKSEVLEVESVDGGTILTRGDYLSAKIKAEDLIRAHNRRASPPAFYNLSDGARIEGADWVSPEAFPDLVQRLCGNSGELTAFQEALRKEADHVSQKLIDERPSELGRELKQRCARFESLIKKSPLSRRVDGVRLANAMRVELRDVSRKRGMSENGGVRLMAFQLMWGSTLQFIYLLLAHGLACEDDELETFFHTWRKTSLEFFAEIPREYNEKVLVRLPREEDSRLFRSFAYEGQ